MSGMWILVADRARARLFESKGPKGPLLEVQSFSHPEGRLAERDLARDRPPRTHESMGSDRHAIEPHTSERDKSDDQFARELHGVLEKGRVEHSYEKLVLIAPPRFLGTLHATLGKHVSACIVTEVAKDLTQSDVETIAANLNGSRR